MAISEQLRQTREATCLAHMTAENAHSFTEAIQAFSHPRYELVPTGEIYDGGKRVDTLLEENKAAFPDFHFDVVKMHHADDAIVVEGLFRGTHLGPWRGLPATGRKVDFIMLLIFDFKDDGMVCERVFFDLNTVFQQLGVAWDPNSVAYKISTVLNHPVTIARALLRALLPTKA